MRKLTRERLETFIATNASSDRCLEIGCGHKRPYKKYFPNSIAIDIVDSPEVDIVASVCKLPFLDNEFNLVLCTEVLEHIPDTRKAINEMYRVLKPGGKIILTTPFIFPLHDMPGDYYRFTLSGLKEVFNDFVDVNIQPAGNSFETLSILLERLILQTKLPKAIKGIIYLISRLLWRLHPREFKEFGSIRQNIEISPIMTWAYYCTARKPSIK